MIIMNNIETISKQFLISGPSRTFLYQQFILNKGMGK